MEIFLASDWREIIWSRIVGSNFPEVGVGMGKNISYHPEESWVTAIHINEKCNRPSRKAEWAEGKVELLKMDAQDMDLENGRFEETVAFLSFVRCPTPSRGYEKSTA